MAEYSIISIFNNILINKHMTEENEPIKAKEEAAVEDSQQSSVEPPVEEATPQQEQIPLIPPASEPVQMEAEPTEAIEPEIPTQSATTEAIAGEVLEMSVEDETKAPIDVTEAPSAEPVKKEKMRLRTIIGIVAVLIIILICVFFATRKPAAKILPNDGLTVKVSSSLERGKVNIIEETKNDINVAVAAGDATIYPQVKITVYLGNTKKNPNSSDCGFAYPLERQIDKKYDSDMINSVLGLLQPLTAVEKEQGYVSTIPAGTTLKYLKLDDSGVMSADFSGNISKVAGSCAVSAIKSAIKQTLLQFSSVKSVIICVNENCREDQILQP